MVVWGVSESALQVQMNSVVTRVRAIVGIDFHVLMTLLLRSWTTLAGAVSVLVVPFFLTTVDQGYYYTFIGILGLQIFFELGLSQVLIQWIGHEIAHLNVKDASVEGDVSRIDQLASLVQLLKRWYRIAAALFAVVSSIAGIVFFEHNGTLPREEWMYAWLVLTLATAFNIAYMPAFAVMEGTGKIGQVARLRLIQSAVGYAGLWAVLFLGGRLWAAVVVPVASIVITSYWLPRQGALYFWLCGRPYLEINRINWRRDILPFQWRIAVSWISGYFIFYTLTPSVFLHQGPVEAGRFGMAINLFNSVMGLGISWVSAKAALFSKYISRGDKQGLNATFMAAFKRSVAFTVAASGFVVTAIYVLNKLEIYIAQRMADLVVSACLAGVCVITCVVYCLATYMRAHKKEPMLAVSVVSGVATACVAYFSSQYSVHLMSIAYLLLNLLLVLPWTVLLFDRYFRHDEQNA